MENENSEKKEKIAEQSINITYETLFDVLRAEKRREDIQQLPPNFFENVVAYMKQKREIIIKREHESGIENYDEIKKLNIQFENVQKIVKEIYERREKKIMMVSLNKSRTKMSTVPMEYLLPQEQEFYEQLTRLLDAYRTDVAEKVIRGMLPKEHIAAVVSSQQSSIKHLAQVEQKEKSVASTKQEEKIINCEAEIINGEAEIINGETDIVKIKFLQETEEFVGPELEVYGPFAANTVAKVPTKIASVFLESGLAEEMK